MNSPALTAWIDGVGLLAPGIPDWSAAAKILRGDQPCVAAPSQLPVPVLLPPAERRRASRIVKLVLALGLEACQQAAADPGTLATVFSSSGADGHNCHALCEQLATDDRQISPTRFHNSVHNAAAGYWSIAVKAMNPCQVLSAYDASFGAGLLDALAQLRIEGQPILLVAYDGEYPEPLFSQRPIPDCGGVALLLSPTPGDRSLARMTVQLSDQPADHLFDEALEKLRLSIPAMHSLPLLQALAAGHPSSTIIDYLPPLQLAIDCQPC
ncbi:MAG TPA: beta-ketoacyl synthase chain length factor [Accumulibacter sp.]|mgnify:CR=1 FL=1|nr:beta-ketoacyl synthase chain length factor [Accumulibacter sp.]HMW18084.1 beta-ketoacyl synthase chain length factor [Accumulibacter sp.]HMX23549.1 beta-ketoacyl synthase chain length factor [Accumulibacter sp.]HMY07435.1 beta-ketoacyl synthase chain length factor [Accumulibacter sp.]HNC17180.1 beta-ketoacyl synthase chain length factor [Accumulibacter sp.]